MTSDAHAAKLLELIGGNWTTQAVGVAAELRLGDILADGPKDLPELAQATSCNAQALSRLLRALVSLGIVIEDGEDYELTPLGALLRADAEPSLRSWAIWTARHQWGPWGKMLESVRTGSSVRKPSGGNAGYTHVEGDATAAAVFNRAMVELTSLIAEPVVRAYDFSTVRRIADVGGGHGHLLRTILAAHPHLHGILLDLPHAIQGARSRFADAGLESRCEFIVGSFFECIPVGCDIYLLKSILHNWDDERCVALLNQFRRTLGGHRRLLIVERSMPERLTGSALERPVIRSDLNMLVGLGGRERTRSEIHALLASAGLVARRCAPIGFGFVLIEGAAG
jgi:DNA-binding HxlR family transcriptional regulator